MPSGIFPVTRPEPNHNSSGRSKVDLGLRIRTWWRRDRLDMELAHGIAPAVTAELSLRAKQLTSRSERSRLAEALTKALGDAGAPEASVFSTRPQRLEILANAEDLMSLVHRLRDGEPISVRGAAMTARLLGDGASPLHRHGEQDLAHAIRAARFALDATTPAAYDMAA